MKEESLLEEIGGSLLEESRGMANVTVRADADCFLICDGFRLKEKIISRLFCVLPNLVKTGNIGRQMPICMVVLNFGVLACK